MDLGWRRPFVLRIVALIGGALLLALVVGSCSSKRATTTAPADSDSPASPACADPPAGQGPVIVQLLPDIPLPRCAKGLPDQKLQLVNKSEKAVSAQFGGHAIAIASGELLTIDEKLGAFLAPGVHRLSLDIYGGSGPEIWLISK